MTSHTAVPSYYAILIGIDTYPDRPLRSCVRDVEMIKDCLVSQLSLVDVRMFTAGAVLGAQDRQGGSWPTCRNVTLAFESIQSQAKPGDFVYIHYSGHGTRMAPCFDYSDKSTGDLALVFLEGDQSREIFFRGPKLAGLINALVNNGLLVTLVLDCCFSASVYRKSDSNIRYLPFDSEGTSESPVYSEEDSANRSVPSANRDGSMRDNWLVNPDRYTILAACGPHENAKGGIEISEKGGWYGALSYFLLSSLTEHGLQRKHKDIYRHVCARFRHTSIPQNPVLYGNGEQGIFGQVAEDSAVRPICIVVRDGKVQLLAGQAHGVYDGDRFAMYSSPSMKSHSTDQHCVAEIIKAGPLTSELRLLKVSSVPRTGWIAEPLNLSHASKLSIRLGLHLPCYEDLIAALSKRSLGDPVLSHQPPVLQVMLNSNNAYDILDGSGLRIASTQETLESHEQVHRICDILDHVARFMMVADLVNTASTTSLRESCHVQIVHEQKTFGPSEAVHVRHRSSLSLAIENRGNTELYAHVYNLGPCWQVKNMLVGTYQAILPKKWSPNSSGIGSPGVFTRKIRMRVPAVLYEHGSCKDIIKVFITSQPTSFDSFDLPNLGELLEKKAGGRLSFTEPEKLEDWIVFSFTVQTSI